MEAFKKTDMPLVSIIISSYNYARYLPEAIDSALQQTYPNTEVIVVDDGSKDASPGIIASYGNKIVAILKQNSGQASSMNAGFNASRGEIIIFLDSDDTLYPETVESVVPYFEDPSVSKVHWILDEINAEGRKTNKTNPKYTLAEGNLLDDVVKYGPEKCGGPPYSPPTSGNAWSRSFIQEIMPIPEELYKSNTDKYLHFLAPVYGEMRAIHKSQGGYRVHGGNYSHHPIREYAGEYLERFEQTCEILGQHLRKKGIDADVSPWPRDSWFHQINDGVETILNIVPSEKSFVLVDENAWGIDNEIENRKRFHFVDKNGQYFGLPLNDEEAINEIEREREKGATYLFFTPNAFWWLDHYSGFAEYLRKKFPLIVDNTRLKGYSLQKI